jgi:FkbM family methyltransferase
MNSQTSTAAYKDLVYDIGMHKGEDTDYYLKKGFRVIGFEANPDLIAYCKGRFCEAIERGRLIIVEGAIVEPQSGETAGRAVKFYKNVEKTIWGTINDAWAQRNEKLGTHNQIVEVDAIDLTECLKRYGIPYYMKIDIEGSDTICLKSLLGVEPKPSYISIESEKVSFQRLREELNLLEQLGYDKFKAIQQQTIKYQVEPSSSEEGTYVGYTFEFGSSGLFGRDLPGRWKTKRQILTEYRVIFVGYRLFGDHGLLKKSRIGSLLRRIMGIALRRHIPGWYDTHARHASVAS